MFTKEIIIADESYEVNIVYAKVNGIIVRIDPIGQISIKANPRYDLAYIENYLLSIESWIKTKQKNIYKNMQILSIKQCLLHQKIWFFGSLFTINEDDKLIDTFYIKQNNIYFPSKFLLDGKYLKIIRQNSQVKLTKLVHLVQTKINSGQEVIIDYKYFSSKWGVCYPKQNRIVLNERLCHLPLELIYLVITHELIHMKVANHSKNFYNELTKVLPNYKKLQKKLKQYSFILIKGY